MIVCPNCRRANDEGQEVCAQCGFSLAPGPSVLRSTTPSGAQQELDLPVPKAPARWPAVVVLIVVLAGIGGFLLWHSLRPQPCRDKFTSARFAYCLAVPQGWRHQDASIGGLAVDQFVLRNQPTTVVVAAFDLPSGVSLDQYAGVTRQRDQRDGLTPGPMRVARLGGADARQWEIDIQTAQGQSRVREVVTVHDDVGWTVELSDTVGGFDNHVPAFDRMLSSWSFK